MSELFVLMSLSVMGFFTSLLTAVFGMGGGILLLALLPGFLPVQAIIPVHGAIQLASNVSRFVFSFHNVLLPPLLQFSVGALIGAVLGAEFLSQVNLTYLPLIMSGFILLILWSPIDALIKRLPGKYFSLGIVQMALSLFVGATGPMSTTVLLQDGHRSEPVIVTSAAINTLIHVTKILVFSSLGFIFADYLLLIVSVSLAAVAGSFVGTRVRLGVPEQTGRRILKAVITAVCIKNVVAFWLS